MFSSWYMFHWELRLLHLTTEEWKEIIISSLCFSMISFQQLDDIFSFPSQRLHLIFLYYPVPVSVVLFLLFSWLVNINQSLSFIVDITVHAFWHLSVDKHTWKLMIIGQKSPSIYVANVFTMDLPLTCNLPYLSQSGRGPLIINLV